MTYAPQSSPGQSHLPACAVLVSLLVPLRFAGLAAQAGAGASPPAATAPASPPAAAAPASPAADDRVEAGRATPLYAVPDSSRLATLDPGAGGRVVGHRGSWVRVQIEGWVSEADLRAAGDGPMRGVTAAEVRAQPDRYVGRTLEWQLQLIAVRRADELRSEMAPGQPYLLTRGPLPESGFVYVTIPADQVERFQGLPNLTELTLRVTVRAARSRFLDTPVVALASVVSGLPPQ